jgi:hypothetical protein
MRVDNMVDGLEKVENCGWQWGISWEIRRFLKKKTKRYARSGRINASGDE